MLTAWSDCSPGLVAALAALLVAFPYQLFLKNKQQRTSSFPCAIPFLFRLSALTEILYLVGYTTLHGRTVNFDIFFSNTRKRLGNVFYVGPLFSDPKLGGPVLVIAHPEDQAAILKKERELEWHVAMPETVTEIHGMQNFQRLKSGQKEHSALRKIYSSILSPKSLEEFTSIMIDDFHSLWNDLETSGKEVELIHSIREAQLKLMCKILYGIDSKTEEEKRILDEFSRDFELTEKALFVPSKKLKVFIEGFKARERISALINERFDAIFEERLSMDRTHTEVKASQVQRAGSAMQQIADALIDAGCTGKNDSSDHHLSYYTARENLYLLLEASHGTTMYITSSLMYFVNRSDNHECLERLRREASILAPTHESLKCFSFGEACVQETMRLAPIVGSVSYHIPAGKSFQVRGNNLQGPVNLLFTNSHWYSDPDTFQHPDTFTPQRWLVDKDNDLAASAFAKSTFRPFGFGRHICLGQPLAKLVLKANLYCFVSKGNRSIKFEEEKVKIVNGIFPMNAVCNGFPAKVVCE
jgi:cytochrome P450